jgi:pyridoxine/pyridoxamine 5'-phosphate oxidase
MTPAERAMLLSFMREERYAVEASVSLLGAPQAAIVGIIVNDRFEVFFDTLDSSRKTANLRRNSTAALVIGPAAAASERTVQLEGPADEPIGAELDRLLELYFARFPDGHERRNWPGITYWRVRPK